jgi:hypothetical protein
MVVLAVALLALVTGGCSDGGEMSVTAPPKPSASLLVRAPPELRVKCQATADAVGLSGSVSNPSAERPCRDPSNRAV